LAAAILFFLKDPSTTLPITDSNRMIVIPAQAGILKLIALRFPIKLGMTIPSNILIH